MTRNAASRILAFREALTFAGKKALPEGLANHLSLAQHVRGSLASFGRAGAPDPLSIGARLAATTTPEEFDAALEQAAHDYARHEALRVANAGGLSQNVETAALRAVEAALPEIRKAVDATFTKAAKALTTASRELPSGTAALDAEAVLNHDAGSAYSTVRDALHTIQILGLIYEPRPRDRGVAAAGVLSLMPLVAIPETTVKQVSNLNGRVVQDTTANQQVRAFHKQATENPRLALVEVARGTYDGLTLNLADNATTLAERIHRVHRTQQHRAVKANPNGSAMVVSR